jgi:hypothetical protein
MDPRRRRRRRHRHHHRRRRHPARRRGADNRILDEERVLGIKSVAKKDTNF